jgi:hypothetical protein
MDNKIIISDYNQNYRSINIDEDVSIFFDGRNGSVQAMVSLVDGRYEYFTVNRTFTLSKNFTITGNIEGEVSHQEINVISRDGRCPDTNLYPQLLEQLHNKLLVGAKFLAEHPEFLHRGALGYQIQEEADLPQISQTIEEALLPIYGDVEVNCRISSLPHHLDISVELLFPKKEQISLTYDATYTWNNHEQTWIRDGLDIRQTDFQSSFVDRLHNDDQRKEDRDVAKAILSALSIHTVEIFEREKTLLRLAKDATNADLNCQAFVFSQKVKSIERIQNALETSQSLQSSLTR